VHLFVWVQLENDTSQNQQERRVQLENETSREGGSCVAADWAKPVNPPTWHVSVCVFVCLFVCLFVSSFSMSET
jgi:hypothetical protein